MAMVFSTSKDCVLQQHPHPHAHDHLSNPYERTPQLKLSLREALQDGQKCTLMLRRPILEPVCRLNCSYEKAFSTRLVSCRNYSHDNVAFSTTLTHIAQTLVDSCGQMSWRQPKVNARIFASLDSDEGKTDGARKALEQMFQGKNNLSKKWEEEIKKRELAGSDDSGGGGSGGGGSGWGGGGGAGDDMNEDFGGQEEPWDWEEFGQTFMATFALIILYFSITHGPKQVFRLFKLFFRYVRQGFRLRKIPEEYLRPGPDEVDSEEEHNSDTDSDIDTDEEEAILSRRTDVSASAAQNSDVQDNHSLHDEAEESEDDMLPPPPEYKKENQIAQIQVERKEKIMQMLTPK